MADKKDAVAKKPPQNEEVAKIWEHASMLSKATIIPDHFKNNTTNVAFAIDYAKRLDMAPLAVMKGLFPAPGGSWAWYTEFLLGLLIRSGRIMGTVEYEEKGEGEAYRCRATAVDAVTKRPITGTWITWKLAKAEGWTRNKKYQTMPENMFRKRAVTFLVRDHYPDVSMGLRSEIEVADLVDAQAVEREGAQAAAESRYSPANVVEVEAEVIEPADVKFTNCEPCSGAGCVLCEGTGVVPE